MIVQRCQHKRDQLLSVVRMKSGALRCNLVPDKGIAECNTAIPTDHARRERVLQIVKVEDECASFANIIVDVSPYSDLLNIVDEKSMWL